LRRHVSQKKNKQGVEVVCVPPFINTRGLGKKEVAVWQKHQKGRGRKTGPNRYQRPQNRGPTMRQIGETARNRRVISVDQFIEGEGQLMVYKSPSKD